MAEGETEKEYATRKAIEGLRERFQELTATLKESLESPSDASLRFCQEFCQILVEHAGRWKTEEEPLPLLKVYTVAILSYAKAISCLSSECVNVPLVLENLALSCVELLLSLPESVPGALWEEFQSSVKSANSLLQEHGNTQLHMLSAMAQEPGVWTNTTLCSILSNEIPEIDRVHEFLQMEGPTLLNMRIKHLIKQNRAEKAAVLAKMCSEFPEYDGKGNFKQTYLVCLCMTKTQEQLMQEIAQVDCKDGLEMICNLESDGDEKGALCLCSVFLKRQLLQGDVYCAWELTLFWSKLLMRSESSADAFLGQCRKLVLLSRSVCHILFLIKVIQSEVGEVGLPVCIEMCIQALQMASSDNMDSRTTICKTISCLLPTDFEGCFVFKPSAKKRRKSPTVEDYFTHGSEDTENSKLRFRTCQTLWEKMKADTELLQDELNKKILDSLLAFIRKSVSTFQRGTDDWASRMRAHEIPTAALVLGVNVPDHDMTFQSLSDQLQQSVTPFVVSVQATECAALNHMMQRVLERLMGTGVSVDDEPEQSSTNVNQKRVHCSLNTLCDWYKTVTKKAASGTLGKKHTSVGKDMQQHPPIVVIFKDLEAFNPRVLQDFILICSRYVEQLPLMFVFGIATSPSTIRHMLPHSVSSLLGIELFQSLSCTQHLATVIDKVILTSQFPFKPSGKVLQVLVSIFLYHDFSVRNFIKGLQLALLEHFHSQPLSVLCCKKEEALGHAAELSHRDVERIQQLPSFMRYVEKQAPQEQVELLTSDDHVKEVCQKLLKDIRKYHKNYYPILRCLHVLTASLPKFPLGKQIRELHISCLEKNVWENEEYSSAMQLLRMMAKDELVSALQKCAEILKPCKTKPMRAALLQLGDLVAKFDQPDDVAAAESAAGEDLTSPGKGLQKKTDLFQLQKTLLEMKKSRRSKKMSQFEILRDQALEFIDSLVRSYLAPPESQPLYEVCYYSSSAVLRRHLNATPRTSIQTALSNPYHYLKNENLRTEDGTVSNAAPDICIVYKLHLECGRLINLYDWLEAYATVVSAAEGKDPDSADYGKVDELKHARFIQAVSELEFLGFIKSTKQKTDHVSRLTWGGC